MSGAAPFPWQELGWLAPQGALAAGALLLLLPGTLKRLESHRMLAGVALTVVGVAAVLLAIMWSEAEAGKIGLAGAFVLDRFAVYWQALVLVVTGLTVACSRRLLESAGYRPAEYYALILFAACGMSLVVSGFHLLTIWIALELMALSSYVLAGYFRRERPSNEAAIKYFVLGAIASGLFIYGISLLYGATGELRLDALAAALPEAVRAQPTLTMAGWLMLAAGLLFKVAAAPFHVWAPDVYGGAPAPVAGFLAAGSKAASFAVLLRILHVGTGPLLPLWQIVLAGLAALSMVWGSLAALTQSNVRRMLAYSSVAHAGYLLIGVLVASRLGSTAVLFYLAAYAFLIVGAFASVALMERGHAAASYADFAGLGRRAPLAAALVVFLLLGLVGLPPTGGFIGKIYLFAAAVEAGWAWLAVLGVLASVVSLYYYFGLVVQMVLRAPDAAAEPAAPSRGLLVILAICAAVTLLLGILPAPLADAAGMAILPPP